MRTQELPLLKAYPVGDRLFIHVPQGRGEELRLHLASHAIHAELSPTAETFDRLEVEGVDQATLQALLDQWER
jgi:hypothetical protein